MLRNKIYILSSYFLISFIFAEGLIDPIGLNKLHVNPNENAYIVVLKGTQNNFSLKKITIEKPKERTLKKLKFMSSKDKYIVKVFGKDKKFLYSLGIGDPFYATYEHIGYEDRKYMGGPVSAANIEIAIPMGIKATSFIISKRDITGKFNDLQEISLQ